MKKVISTNLHGLLDYICGFVLILPYIIGYFEKSEDTNILALVGLGTMMVSLLTDYEWGLIKAIPMKIHLGIDILQAVFLILVPFIFPLYHYAFYWPVVMGCGELLIIFFSSSIAYVVTKRDLNITRP